MNLRFWRNRSIKPNNRNSRRRLPQDVLDGCADFEKPRIQAHEREREKQVGILAGDGDNRQREQHQHGGGLHQRHGTLKGHVLDLAHGIEPAEIGRQFLKTEA